MGYSDTPDQGHAWAIAMAACIITMILSGISKMVGLLYVAVIETYDVTRQQATFPFTFRKSVRCLTGPVVGVLGQRYGVRAVTLVGGVIAALGAALSFLAPSVQWLAVSWGVVHGIGEAFANTLFQVIVNQHFVKLRSTASGIALSGACVGSVCFSFLIEILRDAYGLQGSFLILSGIVLNVIPAAILLTPPMWMRSNYSSPKKEDKKTLQKAENLPKIILPEEEDKYNHMKKLSTVSLNCNLLEKNEILSSTNMPLKAYSTSNLVENLEKKLNGDKIGIENWGFSREKEINYTGLQEKRLSIQNVFSNSKESLNEKSGNVTDEKETKKSEEEHHDKPQRPTALQSIKSIVMLYTNPLFVLICICMSVYVLVLIPVNTTIVDYSTDKGMPESFGKYLIHATAVGDIVGRLCFGWVTDKEYISLPRFMMVTLITQGIFVIVLPFSSSLPVFMVVLGLYSVAGGSMLCRLPILVLKHVKKDEQSVAMGCYGFISGLVPLGIPALIGHFRDDIGTYDGMYYLMGSMSIVSGGLWLLEPTLARLNQKRLGIDPDDVKV